MSMAVFRVPNPSCQNSEAKSGRCQRGSMLTVSMWAAKQARMTQKSTSFTTCDMKSLKNLQFSGTFRNGWRNQELDASCHRGPYFEQASIRNRLAHHAHAATHALEFSRSFCRLHTTFSPRASRFQQQNLANGSISHKRRADSSSTAGEIKLRQSCKTAETTGMFVFE